MLARWHFAPVPLGAMAVLIRDIFLPLTTHPESTPLSAVAEAIGIAECLGAKISATAFEVKFQMPGRVHLFADSLIDIPGLAASQTKKSADAATKLMQHFEAAAAKAGVFRDGTQDRCFSSETEQRIGLYARYSDLTILPIFEGQATKAEAVIFGSGRPLMVIPEERQAKKPFALNKVVVAWDFSRTASRAIADALPLLEMAKQVRVLVILNDKEFGTQSSTERLERYLSHHGIAAAVDHVDRRGRDIGDILEIHTSSQDADLLVMGAYGHSKFSELVLGGATASMLRRPPLPVLMSH